MAPSPIGVDCTVNSFDQTSQPGRWRPIQTISGIPTGTVCTVTEPTLPTVPGWTFGTPTVNPAGPVTITTKGTTYEVIVTNTISP